MHPGMSLPGGTKGRRIEGRKKDENSKGPRSLKRAGLIGDHRIEERMEGSKILKRVDALRHLLEGTSADTAWIVQPENRRYLSGFRAEDTQFTESSGSLLINEAHSLLVTDSRYTTEAEAETAGFEVLTLKKGLTEGLPEILRHLGTRVLGFEEDHVTWGLHKEISDRLRDLSPPVQLVPLHRLVEKMREQKDTEEIAALEASGRLISLVLDEIVGWLEPGFTEKKVAWQIETLAREAGAEGMAFPPIVASGPNGALPHAVPTDRKLGDSEPIVFDVGAKLNGYCSDMTRTIFLGEPQEEFRRIYAIVREAQVAALGAIAPGVMSDHPDRIARDIINEAGFGDYFGHGLGHGVGLATHEPPRLSPLKSVELKEGMVVTVEPGIYLPDKGGVRLEEMVVIEQNGVRILTPCNYFYEFRNQDP